MKERGITEAEIMAVLSDWDYHWPSKDAPNRRIYSGHPGGRTVRVVIEEGTDPVNVITVWSED